MCAIHTNFQKISLITRLRIINLVIVKAINRRPIIVTSVFRNWSDDEPEVKNNAFKTLENRCLSDCINKDYICVC